MRDFFTKFRGPERFHTWWVGVSLLIAGSGVKWFDIAPLWFIGFGIALMLLGVVVAVLDRTEPT
jgi:hypothetical protein